MKEQYDELTAHLRVVILLIAVLVISLFTFIKTDEKNDYYMDKRLSLYDKIVNFINRFWNNEKMIKQRCFIIITFYNYYIFTLESVVIR